MYGSNCRGAEKDGVSILHGNRGVYHDDKQPAFKVVYDAIRDVSARWLSIYIKWLFFFGGRRSEHSLLFCFVWNNLVHLGNVVFILAGIYMEISLLQASRVIVYDQHWAPHHHHHQQRVSIIQPDLCRSHTSACVPAVSLRGQHVPLAVLPHTVQVPGHGQHPVWTDPSSLSEADRKDAEEGFRGEGGPTRQAAQVSGWKKAKGGCSEGTRRVVFAGTVTAF